MENNEEKMKKSTSNKKAIIIIIVFILMLCTVIGVCIGLLVTINNSTTQNNTTSANNSTKNEINITNNSAKNNTSSNNTASNNTSKNNTNTAKKSNKIDDNKPWVYDYEDKQDVKKITITSNKDEEKILKSNEKMVIPYININSEYAQKVNKEIQELYNTKYAKFGKLISTESPNMYEYSIMEYEVNEKENIVSVILYEAEAIALETGAEVQKGTNVYTYNFNTTTLEKASLNEMAQLGGFESEAEVKKKIEEWEESQKKLILDQENGEKYLKDFLGAQENKFCINEIGELNFVCRIRNNYEMDKILRIVPNVEIKSVVQVKK